MTKRDYIELGGEDTEEETALGLEHRETWVPNRSLVLLAMTTSEGEDGYEISTSSAIFCFHSRGPVSCTELPFTSTATVTGMS
jgi:hypothetical protein